MDKRLIMGASIAAAGWAGYVGVRRWWNTWGVEPEEADKPLPGDVTVADGETLLTRGITIDAPPDAVWPWLVQMGYGRGGWYSYDQLDMKGRSAEGIRPEFQSLAVGDIVPTHPDGGFEVTLIEPGRALVVYLDGALAERQAKAQAGSISITETPGLAASGRFLRTASPPDFAVSWAFVLEPVGSDRTRLIERVRGRFGPATIGSRTMLPLMGFGVFVMMRKQMLGIRERAERIVRLEPPVGSAVPMDPSPRRSANGTSPHRQNGSQKPVTTTQEVAV
jgi:hypothetical protein